MSTRYRRRPAWWLRARCRLIGHREQPIPWPSVFAIFCGRCRAVLR